MTTGDRCRNIARHLRIVAEELERVLEATTDPERAAVRSVLVDVQAGARRIKNVSEHLRT